jgi:hypothetical protein
MKRIYLQHWNNPKLIFTFDRDSTLLELEKDPELNKTMRIQGFHWDHHQDKYAVYAIDEKLFFNVNGREWIVNTSEIKVYYRNILFVEIFRLICQKKSVFSRCYFNFLSFHQSLIDPTFDRIDEDRIYFLRWCSKIFSNDKQINDIVRQWSAG